MRSGATRPASRWPTTGAAMARAATATRAIVAMRAAPADVAAVLRWRRPATSHAPPAPTATADSTARPAKLRAFSPRLAAYRAAGASPIAATRRRRGPRPGERSARQATMPQPAIAIASRNAVERSTRSATSTSRASMTDSALSGKSWPVEAQTTTHHQAAVRTAAPMKTAASRARRAGGTDPTSATGRMSNGRAVSLIRIARPSRRPPTAQRRTVGRQTASRVATIAAVCGRSMRSDGTRRQTSAAATSANAVPTAPPGPARSQPSRSAPANASRLSPRATSRAPTSGSPPTSELPVASARP